MRRKLCVSIILAFVCIFFVAVGASAACLAPPSGMLSWWPGDGDTQDIIGPNDGWLQNGASFMPGKVDQAFSFDGVDDLVGAWGAGIGDLQQLTIDAWVKHNSPAPRMIQRYVTLLGEKAVLRYDGGLRFYMRIDESLHHIFVNDVIQDESFHHIAGTYDGSFMRLYLDGEEVGSLNISGTVGDGEGVVLGNGEPFFGLLDEVEIYNRALYASEIQAIYDAGSEGKCKPIPSEYSIEYWHLSHRVYQDGRELNRLAFTMRNHVTGEYPNEDIVASVELYDPNGISVSLNNLVFDTEKLMYGGYDGSSSQWWYDEEFGFSSFHIADVEPKLFPGTYRLVVQDTDGYRYESYHGFNELVDLPMISSHSFRTHRDKFNNFIWEWKVPYGLDPALETSVRAIILIYDKNDNFVGELYTRLPTHFGRLYVPRDIVEKILAQGQRIKLQIQIRTNDQNNRSYSKDRRAKLYRKFGKGHDDCNDR